jgi:hypothetical protein
MVHEPASLCLAFVAALPVQGATIAVFADSGSQSTICSSDATAARIDQLQFDLGEGPHWDALRGGAPVLAPDFAADGSRWPIFAEASRDLRIGSLFAFPMFLGVVTIGAVGLYSVARVDLHASDIATATRLTAATTRRAVERAMRSAIDDPEAGVSFTGAMRREVHQATGIIIVQLETTATDAFMRLRAYAFGAGRSVEAVAGDVVAGLLDFSEARDR